ncbi:MAG: hypothetical protein HY203_07905 [Nitrospirae bacterium]|nr:hypothetical protein [Nitrospirota bacterium]
MSVTIIPAREGQSPNWITQFNRKNPPDVFFDTNVWISMGSDDVANLESLEERFGFRYRYTVTNVAEMASHLYDAPPKKGLPPFVRYRSCFQKILRLCVAEILPSPEMEFLEMTGLSHYLNPVWAPNIEQIMRDTTTVAKAVDVDGVAAIKPDHYRRLHETDSASFRTVMGLLDKIKRPIRGQDKKKLNRLNDWFMTLTNFFLIVRPSNKQAHYNRLTAEERSRFDMAFTNGAGKLFHTHCTAVVKKRINDGKEIAPNDLYDMMQLLLLRNPNRIFVTEDKAFYDYQIEPGVQRVLPWTAFRSSSN